MTKHNTMLRLAQREPEKLEAFIKENSAELAFAKVVNKTLEQLSDVRQYKTQLNTKAMADQFSPEQRTQMLEEARRLEVELVSWLRQARKEYRDAAAARGEAQGRV